MYRHVAEVSVGTGVLTLAAADIEDYTQIRDQYTTTCFIAKFLVIFVFHLLYYNYRSYGPPNERFKAMGEDKGVSLDVPEKRHLARWHTWLP